MMVCSATARANVFRASKPVDSKLEVRLTAAPLLVIRYKKSKNIQTLP